MYIRYDPQHRIRFELGEVEFDFSNPNICHGSGGGGTNTVTQSAPPPQVMAAYETALNSAQSAASAPLQQYSGSTIAGFTPDQTSAFGTVDSAQGMAQPYYNSAQSQITSGEAPLWSGVQQFSPSTVNQYMSPYTSNVLNTTMAAEQNQDQQQQAALQGNAISSGAWGGDRAGVASAVLSGQQDIANNATNANIENTGYNTGLSEFNTQQQSQLGANEANEYLYQQGALNTGNIGTQAENTALTGASAQEASGSIQQQLGQAALNYPYQQFEQQQAYPLQTAQYFANIAEGLGSQAGGLGSSTTTNAAPSAASTAAGFGVGGLGLYGAATSGSDASNGVDALSSARGGRIAMRQGGSAFGTQHRGYAFGGLATGPSLGSNISSQTGIPDLSVTYVPSPMGTGSVGGKGPPQPTSSSTTGGQKSSGPPQGSGEAIKGGMKLYKHLNAGQTPSDGGDNALDVNSNSAIDMQGEANPMDLSNSAGNSSALAPDASATDASGSAGNLTGDATGSFGTSGGSGAGVADTAGSTAAANSAADTAGTAAATNSALDAGAAGSSTAAAGSAAGAAATDASATAATAGVTSALGAGSAAGIVDGATAEAAIDAGITDAAAGVVGDSLAAYAPLLLLAAKRGGRIGALGSKRYDAGGTVGPVGGQSPATAANPVTGPLAQTYNSAYQNMTPEQLQQIMMRLPPGSQQQKSAQSALQQKRMMPNVGTQAQGGFGTQGQPGGQPAAQSSGQTAATADTGDMSTGQAPAQGAFRRGGFADGGMSYSPTGNAGIQMDVPPPPDGNMSMPDGSGLAPAALDPTTPLGKALMGNSAFAAAPAGAKASRYNGPPSAMSMPASAPPAGDASMAAQAANQTASEQPTPSSSNNSDSGSPSAKHISANPWLSLAKAGFEMAGGTSPYAGVNIGRGAAAGVGDYEQQSQHADSVNDAADKLMQEAVQHKSSIAIEQQKADQEKAYQTGELANQSAALKQKQIMKDNFGNIIGTYDPVSNSVIPIKGMPGAGGSSSLNVTGSVTGSPQGALAQAGGQGSATPPGALPDDMQQRLAQVAPNPKDQAIITGLIQGRIAPNRQALGANPQNYIAAAADVDPTFDSANPTQRMKTATDYSPGGTSGKMITSLNTASRHAAATALAAIDLNNSSVTPWNSVANSAETMTGDPRVTNYNSYLGNYGHEAIKVISGKTNPGEAETEEFMKPLAPNGSTEQLLGALSAKNGMMLSRAEEMKKSYDASMGPAGRQQAVISPDAQQAFQDMDVLTAAAHQGNLKSPEAQAARARLETYSRPVKNGAAAQGQPPQQQQVRVRGPNGQTGMISPAELNDALKNGWQQVQ